MHKLIIKSSKFFWLAFLLLLLVDFFQSNYHYSNLPMDGDVARIAAPMLWYEDVLRDPIGIEAITEHKKYSGAGRYVCHVITKWWFTDVFVLIKKIVQDPVNSIYFTATAMAAFLHLLFISLALLYSRLSKNAGWKKWIILACLASVLIQLNAFYDGVGLIDRSTDYCFFYALPIFVLLFYFLPFYNFQQNNTPVKKIHHLLLFSLAPLLAFSGPLIQPIVFILSLLYFMGVWIKNPFFKIKMNTSLLAQLAWILFWCLYAFYVSQYNSESSEPKALGEKYVLLAKGLFKILTLRLVWFFILAAIGINIWLIRTYQNEIFQRLKPVFYFGLAFCAIYILLLPLGGYRSYRLYIIRYDTFIPVTLIFFYFLILSVSSLLQHLTGYSFIVYLSGLFLFCFIFFIADKELEKEANYCEQGQLYEILESNETIVRKEYKCNVLMWEMANIYDVENMKAINTCLKKWGVLKPNQQLEYYEKGDPIK